VEFTLDEFFFPNKILNMNRIRGQCLWRGTAPKKRLAARGLFALFFTLFFLGVSAPPNAKADEILNNDSIVVMQGLNLGDAVIIAKIRTSKCNFDTSVDGLMQLKAAHVSDAVIKEMIAPASASSSAGSPSVATGDLNDPAAPHPAGIWISQETGSQKKLTRLDSEMFISHQTDGGGGGWGMAWGASMKTRAILSGAQATILSSGRRPVFYLYIGGAGQNPAGDTAVYVQNPKDMQLVQFEVKKDQRSLVTGSVNAYAGSSFGIDPGAIRPFDSEMVAEGIYKVFPKLDLADGEYAFCTSMSIQGQGRSFTFRIHSSDAINNPVDPEVEKLCESLKAEKSSVVIQALKKLRGMNAPEAVPQILPCLTSSNPNIIRDACRTLAVLGSKDVIPSIEPLLKHPKPDVRKDAQDAIDALQAK
jgi:hypothetical protein